MARDEELQERTCRACDRTFKYPVPRSLATRFHCEDCAQLPPGTRAMFEMQNKRLKALSAEVNRLKAAAAPATKAASAKAGE